MNFSANQTATQRPPYAKASGGRRLILVRHAKAMEDDGRGDHARGLSEQGRAEALALGEWLKGQGLVPDLVLCSTAARTRETLAQLALGQVPVILGDTLYLASAGEMLQQIQATDDAVRTLVVIAHNPGVHALVGQLVAEFAREEDADRLLLAFPTAAAAVFGVGCESWRAVRTQSLILERLHYL